jgi:uncharacterized protein DUF6894
VAEAANDQNAARAPSKAPYFLHSATCKLAEADSGTCRLIFSKAMPRYFFHIHDKDGIDQDDAGVDLVNFQDARSEALSLARSLLSLE